jgi:hypothetical protein
MSLEQIDDIDHDELNEDFDLDDLPMVETVTVKQIVLKGYVVLC